MIEILNLSKSYGNKKALTDVSFSVGEGEIIGLLGANGAGKSTMMNIITGYLSSSGGTVKIDGIDILDAPQEAKKKIGYLPEMPPLYLDMTVEEYLDFVYDLKKLKEPNKAQHIKGIVKKLGIVNVYKRKIANLSKGYKQRVGLAQALLGNPKVLILDEPTVGLDPKQIIEIRTVIQELGKDHTVILSSHILSEVRAVCERVVIIKNGRVVVEDTPENLANAFDGKARISLRVIGNEADVKNTLSSIPNIGAVDVVSRGTDGCATYEIEVLQKVDEEFSKALFYAFAKADMPILELKQEQATLEEVFIELTASDDQNKKKPVAQKKEGTAQ